MVFAIVNSIELTFRKYENMKVPIWHITTHFVVEGHICEYHYRRRCHKCMLFLCISYADRTILSFMCKLSVKCAFLLSVRERRDRQTDRQTDRRTDGRTYGRAGRQTDTHTDTQRQTDTQTARQRERETDRQTEGERGGGRERERKTDRQTDRQTDR